MLLGTLVGPPLGALLAVSAFPERGEIIAVLNAAMGLPTVVVGLVLYPVLSRFGLFGSLGLLFTPAAMIAAQAVLVRPLIAAFLVLGPPRTFAQQDTITLASTASTDQSCLCKGLLPNFKEATGIAVRVVALDAGKALGMGRRGDSRSCKPTTLTPRSGSSPLDSGRSGVP